MQKLLTFVLPLSLFLTDKVFCKQLKDYYKILGILPSATLADVKMAYRKLAHQYHPDKNPSNQYAEAHFSLIKEAYTTLTDPEQKEKYLHQRWLHKTMGKGMQAPAITPPQILNAVLNAHQQYIHYDEHRVDKKGLLIELLELINDEKVTLLNKFNQQEINQEIIKWMINNLFLLYPADQLHILDQLEKIDVKGSSIRLLRKKYGDIRQNILINRYKPYFILLLIVLLCMIIAYSL